MRKCFMKISRIVEFGAVQKCANLVDLVKSFQTSIYLQTLALIQPSPVNLVCGLSRFSCLGPEEPSGTISF